MTRLAGLLPLLAVWLPAPTVWADWALTDTDRVLFYGSTPRWPASYGLQVETFVRVKYPSCQVRFWHWPPQLPRTIEQGAEDLAEHLQVFRPTIVVLGFGLYGGDTRAFSAPRLSAFTGRLVEMLEQCGQAGARVVLVTPNCPEAARKQLLTKIKYDEVVGQYAQAIKDLAAESSLPLVDWYQATRDYAAAHPPGQDGRNVLTTDGLNPKQLANTLAAEALLEVWGAQPLEVDVQLDWATLETSTSAGSVTATRRSESIVAVELQGFPLPWAVTGRSGVTPMNWGPRRFCRFAFQVKNAPPGGLVTSAPGSRPMSWPQPAVEAGLDLSVAGPLLRCRELVQLMTSVKKKNKTLEKLDRWMKKPFPEPEYADAIAKYAAAMLAEAEGTEKIIQRTPRTLDLTVEFRLVKPPAKKD
ncbi:MAG: hypothetical protein IID40_04405 [Planctomycetes bacterium]|nr:hypothetical protein [Planctomycetota bacterium]